MFKKATIFSITPASLLGTRQVAQMAEKDAFIPCGPTQEHSAGWVPPRGQAHGAMVESVGGHHLMKMVIEKRSVPAKAINEVVDEKCKQIERNTGRTPGKKEKRELKEEAKQTLLPHAFPKKTEILVWADTATGYLVVDSTSSAKVDEVVTRLCQLSTEIVVTSINTATSPGRLMTDWLHAGDKMGADDRFGFDVGTSCELKAADETKARVRYNNHELNCFEVAQHIEQGKTATKLGLTYGDRVEFILNEAGTLTGIKFLDVVFADSAKTHEDEFDANVAILTGEMSNLIPELVKSLGGQIDFDGQSVDDADGQEQSEEQSEAVEA